MRPLALSVTALLLSSTSLALADEPEPDKPRVRVIADAPDAMLYQDGKPICAIPCERPLEASAQVKYYVAGQDIMRSRTFSLQGTSGSVLVDVKTTSKSARGGAIALTVLGAGIMAAGFALVWFGGIREEPIQGFLVAGTLNLAIGAAGVVGGALLLGLKRSDVTISRLGPSPGGLSFQF